MQMEESAQSDEDFVEDGEPVYDEVEDEASAEQRIQEFLDAFMYKNFKFAFPHIDEFTMALICLIPLGYLFQKVTRNWLPTHRYLISGTLGVAVLLYLFPLWEVTVMAIHGLIGLLLLRNMPADKQALVVFLFCMIYQTILAIYVFIRVSYWHQSHVFIIAPVMCQTQRLTMLSVSLYDGWRKSKGMQLTPLQEKHCISVMPDRLKIFAYLCNFHQTIYGPAVAFSDYEEFMESAEYQKKLHSPEISKSLLGQILVRFFRGCFCLFAAFCIDRQTPLHVLYTREFMAIPFLTKCICLYPLMFSGRCYFYYMWSFCECANLAAGLGYSGTDSEGQPQWDIGRCCNFFKVELAGCIRDSKNNWNMCTQNWLRLTVFERIKNKFLSNWVVFSIVFIWHGVNAGYFWYAFTCGYIFWASRESRLSLRPRFHAKSKFTKNLYDICAVIVTIMGHTYMSVPFFCFYFYSIIFVWSQIYYAGHIVCSIYIFTGLAYRYRHSWLRLLRRSPRNSESSESNKPINVKNFDKKSK